MSAAVTAVNGGGGGGAQGHNSANGTPTKGPSTNAAASRQHSHSPSASGMSNSVRKRLSLLRLGKKSSKEGKGGQLGLGGLYEEE